MAGDEGLAPLPWHAAHWERLVARRRQGSLPHALLLAGPSGVGKQRFARHLAVSLVCEVDDPARTPCGHCRSCQLAAGGNHPDIRWIAPEEEGKAIRIDAIRELIGQSALTAQARGLRVFVVDPADAMNPAAANALLKTLEEPPPSSCLLLVSSRPHRLPQTILSRCQRLLFRNPEPEIARRWLAQHAAEVTEAALETALALAGGAPLTALAFLQEQEQELEETVRVATELEQLARRAAQPLEVARRWSGQPVDRQLARLRRVLFDLARAQAGPERGRRYLPQKAAGLQKWAGGIDLRMIFRYLDEMNRFEREMVYNLNPTMLMEKLVTDWLSLTRPEKR